MLYFSERNSSDEWTISLQKFIYNFQIIELHMYSIWSDLQFQTCSRKINEIRSIFILKIISYYFFNKLFSLLQSITECQHILFQTRKKSAWFMLGSRKCAVYLNEKERKNLVLEWAWYMIWCKNVLFSDFVFLTEN